MAAPPTAVVTAILDITEDPDLPLTNTLITVNAKMLFMGPVPLQEQISASILNVDTKSLVKAKVNAAITLSALDKGYVLTSNHILVVSDIAG